LPLLTLYGAFVGGLRGSRESATTRAVALSWLNWVHTQPLLPPVTGAPAVSAIDSHCLTLANYDRWLASAAMQKRRAATRRAYCFRLKRYLVFRRTRVPTLAAAASVNMAAGYGVALAHLSSLIGTLTRAASACQATRFTQKALTEKGEWADVGTLLRAVRGNRKVFNTTIQRAAAQGTAKLADRCVFCVFVCSCASPPTVLSPFGASRSFTLQYILAAAYLEVGPARPSFWEGLNLTDWWAAVAHPEHILASDRFKTSATYGVCMCVCLT
jgi:hypothetical protein